MVGEIGKDYYYFARIYKQKALIKQIEDDIKTMAYTLLRADRRKLEISKCENNEGYNIYEYCKSNDKQYCPAKNKKWRGLIKDYDKEHDIWTTPYMLYSDSELGVYLEVLNFYYAKQSVYPGVL